MSLPTAHLERYRRIADELNMPLGDYVAIKMAEAHGFPEPDYIAAERERIRKRDEAAARRSQREELPISA
jgi:hypothetical protein